MNAPDNGDERHFCGIVELLKVKGDARAVSVVVNALETRIEHECYDNWNGGLYNVRIHISVDCQTYGQIPSEELERLRTAIGEVAVPILTLSENDTFTGVFIHPLGSLSDGWREKAAAWVRGDGVTNQGRVRSDNIAASEHDGLLFRSAAEINFYKALKSKGVTFAPLPVFIRGGRDYRRLEPDFLVIKDGYVFQVEIDGDTFHKETPVDAQSRTAPMEYEGVRIRRFRASDLSTEEMANRAVEKLLTWIEKEKKNR